MGDNCKYDTEYSMRTCVCVCVVAVIYVICEEWDLNFVAMYACTGLWNAFFLIIYAFTDASRLMKWATRLLRILVSLHTTKCCIKLKDFAVVIWFLLNIG